MKVSINANSRQCENQPPMVSNGTTQRPAEFGRPAGALGWAESSARRQAAVQIAATASIAPNSMRMGGAKPSPKMTGFIKRHF